MLHTAEDVTCPIIDAPDNYHFEDVCEDCEVKHLRHATRAQVEDRYHQGRMSQDVFEAYGYVWATAAFRYGGTDGWEIPPTDPAARRIARKMYRRLGRAVPVEIAAD